MDERKMNIYQKLAKLREETKQFQKDKEGYQYKYVTGSLIFAKINPIMERLGLVFVPDITAGTIKYDRFEYDAKTEKTDKKTKEVTAESKTKVDFIVSGEMSYKLINVDEPSETITYNWAMFGQQDDVAKAYGSALTYAERYMLLKVLGLPTDDIDPDLIGNEKIEVSDEQAAELYMCAGAAGFAMYEIKAVLSSRYQKLNVQHLSGSQYSGLFNAIKNNPKDIRRYLDSRKEILDAAGIGDDE
jgi:hypothetical protein